MGGTSTVFIGRIATLKELRAFAEKAFHGQACVVGLSGPVGCGKSTLVRQFIAELQGEENKQNSVEVLTGQCIDAEAMPYLPFIEALRGYFQISGVDQNRAIEGIKKTLLGVGKDAVGLLPVVGPLLTIGVSLTENIAENFLTTRKERDIEQGTLFLSISQILSGIARKKRAVLIIEDVHWADQSSLCLLQFLAADLQKSPVLILVTFRSDLPVNNPPPFATVWKRLIQKGLAVELPVSNFSPSEFDQYLCEVFEGDPIHADVKKVLYTQTHGNPFFLAQLIPVLLRENILVKERQTWMKKDLSGGIPIPATIEAAVQEVLARLEPQTHDLLEIAAVIGNRFEYPLLATVGNLEEDDLESRLDQLESNHILTELPDVIDVFEFIHAVVREVVYHRITQRKRRRAHLLVAKTIESLYAQSKWDVLETVASHYRQAGEKQKALEYYKEAVNKAISLVAYDEALRAIHHLLDLLEEDSSDRATLLQVAGRLADYTSQWELGSAYYQELKKFASQKQDRAALAEAYEGLATICFREGKWVESEAHTQQHLRLAKENNDPGEMASAMFNLGRVAWRTGRWPEAKRALQEALQIQKDHGLTQFVLPAIAILGVVHRNQGLYQEALELYEEGIDFYNQQQSLDPYWLGTIYNNMGTALRSIAAEEDLRNPGLESAYWDRAVEAYEKSLEIMQKIGSLRDLGNTDNNLAIIFSRRRRPDLKKAISHCDRARQNLSRIEAPVDLLDTLRISGAIQGRLANYEHGRQLLEESLAIARRIGALDKIALAETEIGRLLLLNGQKQAAQEHIRTAREVFTNLGALHRLEELDLISTDLE